jgi:hypothetical protein
MQRNFCLMDEIIISKVSAPTNAHGSISSKISMLLLLFSTLD